MALTRVDKDEIAQEINEGGFDVVWRSYGSLTDFKDARLKALVLDYLRACRDLAKYVGAKRPVREVSDALRDWRST